MIVLSTWELLWWNNTISRVMPRTPRAWKVYKSVNICPNWTSEKLINIYTKSRCQWSGYLIKLKFEQQSYASL